jgi:AP-1 complex subunit beta-1
MSAVKVIMGYLEQVTNADTLRALSRKLAPPLVTLLSTAPEIQYVALRNINLIVQKRPSVLSHEIKVFFCKCNDPIYVKMEKLEIIIRLVSDRNIEQVLLELKEYATEVDVDFVRKAVRAIGRCAIKLERAAERCINVLLELTQTKVNYVVQEAVIVIKDIFRKYPNRYESIIATLCENLDTLDEPEAKGSMIWIIGEYAERIDNAGELLETFLDSFRDGGGGDGLGGGGDGGGGAAASAVARRRRRRRRYRRRRRQGWRRRRRRRRWRGWRRPRRARARPGRSFGQLIPALTLSGNPRPSMAETNGKGSRD